MVLVLIVATPAHAGKLLVQAGTGKTPAPHRSEPAAGTAWREPKTDMIFVWIPSGCFQMGSNKGEQDEMPVHKVCVKGFWIGKYEVTQGQYQRVMGNNPSKFRGDNNPVEMVSWQEANVMAEDMSNISGIKVSLPSEAQWEYACRAGGAHENHCGGDVRHNRMAWYGEHFQSGSTHPVGHKAPNAWGLYDMSGNVWERVADTYHENYNDAPADGSAWGGGENRVLRGGSWGSVAENLRASYRFIDPARRGEYYGFRLARILP
jgi:formylglycine-generating enzyme required for sulfatase activity